MAIPEENDDLHASDEYESQDSPPIKPKYGLGDYAKQTGRSLVGAAKKYAEDNALGPTKFQPSGANAAIVAGLNDNKDSIATALDPTSPTPSTGIGALVGASRAINPDKIPRTLQDDRGSNLILPETEIEGPPVYSQQLHENFVAPGPSEYARNIAADYNERLGAMEDERKAHATGDAAVADALKQRADYQTQTAVQMGKDAEHDANVERGYRNDIHQQMHDYMNAKVDPRKFWHDQSAPERIATVIGAALTSVKNPELAARQIKEQVDRSIALQEADINKKKQGAEMSQTLLQSYMQSSKSRTEAYDKTRATLLDASLTDITRLQGIAKTAVQQAQLRQLYAQTKAERDTVLGRIQSDEMKAAYAAYGAANGGGEIRVDGEQIVTDPSTGEQYIINNKTEGKPTSDYLSALDRLSKNIDRGNKLLNERSAGDYVSNIAGMSDNFNQGETIDASNKEAIARLYSARGVPPHMKDLLEKQMTQYGTLAGPLKRAKGEEMKHIIADYKRAVLAANGATPAQIRIGSKPNGKNAGELEYYARPGARTLPGKSDEAKKDYSGFQPDK